MCLLGQVSTNLYIWRSIEPYNFRLEGLVSFRLENIQDPV